MTQPSNVSSQDLPSESKTADTITDSTADDLNQKDPCNVFIKYLPPELTDSGLYSLFVRFGEIVSCKVMVDPITGHSLGYGFYLKRSAIIKQLIFENYGVEQFCKFSKPEEAQRAIQAMSGYQISNKTLLCKLSNSVSGNNATPSDNLYIKPLLQTTTAEQLRELFGKFGPIKDCKVMIDKTRGCSRQIGFVRFVNIADATKALKAMNGYVLEPGTPPIVVKYAESEEQKRARRMKLLQNQTAAAARQAAQLFAQLQLQQQQQQQQQQSTITTSQYYPTSLAALSPPFSSSGPSLIGGQGNTSHYPSTSTSFGSSPIVGNIETTSLLSPPQSFQSLHSVTPPNMNVNLMGYNSNYWNALHPYFASMNTSTFTTPQSYSLLPVLPTPQIMSPYPIPAYSSPISTVTSTPKTNVDDKSNLFVFHLPHSVTDIVLWQMFTPFGPLESVKVIRDKETGKSKGYGFVKFLRVSDAIKAMNAMNGRHIENKRLKVTFKSRSSNKSPNRTTTDTNNTNKSHLTTSPPSSPSPSSSSPPLSPSPSSSSSLSPSSSSSLSPSPIRSPPPTSSSTEIPYKTYHKKTIKYQTYGDTNKPNNNNNNNNNNSSNSSQTQTSNNNKSDNNQKNEKSGQDHSADSRAGENNSSNAQKQSDQNHTQIHKEANHPQQTISEISHSNKNPLIGSEHSEQKI